MIELIDWAVAALAFVAVWLAYPFIRDEHRRIEREEGPDYGYPNDDS